MTPEVDPSFAARCRELCPGFRAAAMLPARKSEVLAGELDGVPVIAKRLARPDDVWAWYFARELAIARAFAAAPPPLRVPALYAAADDVLVVERLPGAPLATRRSPQAVIDDAALRALLAIGDRLAQWTGSWPRDLPPAGVRSQLRARFLEDPTAPVEWIRDGVTRAARRELLPAAVATQIVVALDDHTITAASHGDLLLRNAVWDGTQLGLVDWECAGPHLADWDRALLWTQLAPAQRPLVEAACRTGTARARAFLGLVAFALARELSFLHAFRSPRGATFARIRDDLAEVCARFAG